MIDLIGVNPIFSTAIRLVIAQRLVRRLVDETKEQYEPDQATRDYVKKVLEGIPSDIEQSRSRHICFVASGRIRRPSRWSIMAVS